MTAAMHNSTNHEHGALEAWLTWMFSPTISAILVTLLVSLITPVLVHFYLYQTRGKGKSLPTFLLVGPSGAGKTTLLTLFANASPTSTHTSQTPMLAQCQLPSQTRTAADKYRSENDTSAHDEHDAPAIQLLDTPGHGKLRHHAFEALTPSATDKAAAAAAPRGVIFLLDSSAPSLTEAGEFLHDVLLALQKRHTRAKSSKGPDSMPVLVAANKQDLFTALPPALLAAKLQEEIGRVRERRARGVTGAGATGEEEEEENWLGEFGSRKFEFGQMAEYGIDVTVLGGNVRGEDEDEKEAGRRVNEWWAWIGENI